MTAFVHVLFLECYLVVPVNHLMTEVSNVLKTELEHYELLKMVCVSVCLSDRQVPVRCEGGALFYDEERFSKGSSVVLEVNDDSPAQSVEHKTASVFALALFAKTFQLKWSPCFLVCLSQGRDNRDQHRRGLVQAHRWH